MIPLALYALYARPRHAAPMPLGVTVERFLYPHGRAEMSLQGKRGHARRLAILRRYNWVRRANKECGR